MIKWFRNLFKKKTLKAQDLENARLRYSAKESEINELKRYSQDLCPLIRASALYGSGQDSTIHNAVLNKAIAERITALRKEQEELLVWVG